MANLNATQTTLREVAGMSQRAAVVAGAGAEFLARDESFYLTGIDVVVDGGMKVR